MGFELTDSEDWIDADRGLRGVRNRGQSRNWQGTQVVGIYAGFVDTGMAAHSQQSKTSPHQAAQKTLEEIVAGASDAYADERTEEVWKTLKSDPGAIYAPFKNAGTSAEASFGAGGTNGVGAIASVSGSAARLNKMEDRHL